LEVGTHGRDNVVNKPERWTFQEFIRQLRSLNVLSQLLLSALDHRGIYLFNHIYSLLLLLLLAVQVLEKH
jgi:hypothetical protein